MERIPKVAISPRFLLISMLLLCMGGCTSIKSTLLYQDAASLEWMKFKSKGYPITLRVPTHIKVEIVEKSYLFAPDDSTLVPLYDADDRLLRKYDFRTQVIETDKLFTVDQKRPCAGTANYNAHFSPDHSIEKLQTKLADDSIQQVGLMVSNTLNTLAGQETTEFSFTDVQPVSDFGDPTGKPQKGARPAAVNHTNDVLSLSGDPDTLTLENVIAAQIFEIDAPDFERQIQAFLQTHFCEAVVVP